MNTAAESRRFAILVVVVAAILLAVGLTDADLERPLVAVVSTWTDVMPCTISSPAGPIDSNSG